MSDSKNNEVKKGKIREGIIKKGGTLRLPTNPNAENPFVPKEVIQKIRDGKLSSAGTQDSKK